MGDQIDPQFIGGGGFQPNYIFFNRFFEQLEVAGLQTVTLATFVVTEPNTFLNAIAVGGQNRAEFTVMVNSNKVAVYRTYFTEFNGLIELLPQALEIGDMVTVQVSNKSNSIANFECRIMGFNT